MPPSKQQDYTNILNRVRQTVFGKQNQKQIDQIDDILTKVTDKVVSNQLGNQLELFRKVIGQNFDNNFIRDVNLTGYDNTEFIDRLARYQDYESIAEQITYCGRALKVIADGILSPDDITKKSLQISSEVNDAKKFEDVKEIKYIVKRLDLDRLLYDSVNESLKLGDSFIEIVNYKAEDIPITQTMLNESNIRIPDTVSINLNENCKFNLEVSFVTEKDSSFSDLGDEPNSKNKSTKEDQAVSIDSMKLIKHDPRLVLKLQTLRNKLCIGYLVFPDIYISNKTFSASSGRLLSALNPSAPDSNTSGVDELYKVIIKQIYKLSKDKKLAINKQEVMNILDRVVREVGASDEYRPEDKQKLEIRFVPEYKMVHFYCNNSKFFPYGESIFQKILFKAKALIALESATIVKRMQDSTDKRIVYYETGLGRDGKNVVEDIRGQLNKRTFSVGTLGSIAQIPSMLTTYETLYVPQTKGKRFIEFDRMEPSADIAAMVESLKYFRDSLIAGLDVPPPYLNLEENLSNKNSLSFENALFSETIVGYQYTLNACLLELIRKIYRLIRLKNLPEHLIISFPPPKMLQLERESERIDFAIRSIQGLKEIGVPTDWSKKQFLMNMPWEEIEDFIVSNNLDKKLEGGAKNVLDPNGAGGFPGDPGGGF